MDSPLDDKALAVLDDYCNALRQDDTEEGPTLSSCPTDANDATGEYFRLLKELDDARRMLKEDTCIHFGEELLPQSEPPARAAATTAAMDQNRYSYCMRTISPEGIEAHAL